VSLTSESKNVAEVEAISSHFFYASVAVDPKQAMQLLIMLMGVLNS
jgi:hypothetical protein